VLPGAVDDDVEEVLGLDVEVVLVEVVKVVDPVPGMHWE
jgi:hypothetical protein